ncbi:tetratricopeptide repeat protein [Streptomyces microflavus]|uniref:tetratricopeptide repeat protein n=1 Tax=Streptomyces microflavus TaxID=1919 RepID=UPI0036CAA1B4
MTHFLQQRTTSAYVARTEGQWQTLFQRAREEQDRAQMLGRPSKPKSIDKRPNTLPATTAGFAGRAAELKTVLDWMDPYNPSHPEDSSEGVTLFSIAGMGGVGKTELALQAAHQATERGWFSGGALFADIGGYGSEAELSAAAIADRFLRALGISIKNLPSEAAQLLDLWHAHLHELRAREQSVLLVLDNVRTLGTIAKLIPSGPHRLLITTRHKPAVLPGRYFSLGPMDSDDAVGLLESLLRVRDAADDRVECQEEQAREIVALCGNLPLALRITGALLQENTAQSLHHHVNELRAEHSRLDMLEYEDVDREGRPLAVRACFDLSYRYLPADCKRAFRLISSAPGASLSDQAANVLLGREARKPLRILNRNHLLTVHSESRWSMHDLIRLFGNEEAALMADRDGQNAALDDLHEYYVSSLRAANECLTPGRECVKFTTAKEAFEWLTQERKVLIAVALSPAARRRPLSEHPGFLLARYLDMQRRFEDVANVAADALNRSRAEGSAEYEAHALSSLGNAFTEMRRPSEAAKLHEEALVIYRAINQPGAEAAALVNLGSALQNTGRYNDAYYAHSLAVFYFQNTGQSHGLGTSLVALSQTLLEIGRPKEALRTNRQGIRILEQVGDAVTAAGALVVEADIYSRRQDGNSIALYRAAIKKLGAVGDSHGAGVAYKHLADELLKRGRVPEALDSYGAASHLFRRSGDLVAENIVLKRISSLSDIDE